MAKSTSAGVTREKVKPGIWRRKIAKGKVVVYEITFRDSDGRQRRQTVHGRLRDAETALREVKLKMGKGERVAPNRMLTFAVASEKWIKVKAPNLTPKTIQTYRYALDVHLLPKFGKKRLTEISTENVANFISEMATVEYRRKVESRNGKPTATTGYSAQTIKSVLIPLSRTFVYAKRQLGHGGENPVIGLEPDERPGYRQHRVPKTKLGRDELDRLIEAARSPYREIIATAIGLGTRLGETLGIHWRDVDLENGNVRIAQQANAKAEIVKLKTQTAYRMIEAPTWLIAMLREIKLRSAYSDDDHLVFCTITGRPHRHGNVLGRGLYPALDRAGLQRVSFHSLRHSHASLWIKDGGDPVTLSKRLGHATPQVTMTVYADEIREANDDAARRAQVDALFGSTRMAASLAATDGNTSPQMANEGAAEVVSLSAARSA